MGRGHLGLYSESFKKPWEGFKQGYDVTDGCLQRLTLAPLVMLQSR